MKPLNDSLTTFPSLVELSHCLDDLLLDGPPRIATGALPVMNITPTLVYKLWERWLEYTNRYPDASSTKVVFEMHKAKRVRPVCQLRLLHIGVGSLLTCFAGG